MGLFQKLFHRHTWKPLKTMYRYRDGGYGDLVCVKKCQCRGCGRFAYIHFIGKEIYYKDWRVTE